MPRFDRASVTAAVLAAAVTLGTLRETDAQVVRPLPAAPFPGNPTATTIANARIALASANVPAASRAQFAYRESLARYARGDFAGARASAVQALTLLAEPNLRPAETIPPLATGGLGSRANLGAGLSEGGAAGRGPLGAGPFASALQVDEDELLARSRSAVASCAARKPDELRMAETGFDAVYAAHEVGDAVAERRAASKLIARCGVLFYGAGTSAPHCTSGTAVVPSPAPRSSTHVSFASRHSKGDFYKIFLIAPSISPGDI